MSRLKYSIGLADQRVLAFDTWDKFVSFFFVFLRKQKIASEHKKKEEISSDHFVVTLMFWQVTKVSYVYNEISALNLIFLLYDTTDTYFTHFFLPGEIHKMSIEEENLFTAEAIH